MNIQRKNPLCYENLLWKFKFCEYMLPENNEINDFYN